MGRSETTLANACHEASRSDDKCMAQQAKRPWNVGIARASGGGIRACHPHPALAATLEGSYHCRLRAGRAGAIGRPAELADLAWLEQRSPSTGSPLSLSFWELGSLSVRPAQGSMLAGHLTDSDRDACDIGGSAVCGPEVGSDAAVRGPGSGGGGRGRLGRLMLGRSVVSGTWVVCRPGTAVPGRKRPGQHSRPLHLDCPGAQGVTPTRRRAARSSWRRFRGETPLQQSLLGC